MGGVSKMGRGSNPHALMPYPGASYCVKHQAERDSGSSKQ